MRATVAALVVLAAVMPPATAFYTPAFRRGPMLGARRMSEAAGDLMPPAEVAEAVAAKVDEAASVELASEPASEVAEAAPEATGAIHTWGANLKTQAREIKASLSDETGLSKVSRVLQCVGLYALFVVYRAWRGFFVIVPEVFREVQAKLKAGIVEQENTANADVDPSTGKLRMRSAFVVWLGASMVTAVFTVKTVIGGVGTVFARLMGMAKGKDGSDDDKTPAVA